MARRMKTSRAALDRLLDPDNTSVTLQTLCRAARAIGRDLRIELVRNGDSSAAICEAWALGFQATTVSERGNLGLGQVPQS